MTALFGFKRDLSMSKIKKKAILDNNKKNFQNLPKDTTVQAQEFQLPPFSCQPVLLQGGLSNSQRLKKEDLQS